MNTKVACAGVAVLDRVYLFDALPLAPGKHIATGYRENGGGMAANAAVAIAALGAAAAWCGRLGDDATGKTLMAMLRRCGVSTEGATITPDLVQHNTPQQALLYQMAQDWLRG